jgi:RNA polymerase sigma-70 factor, ECF subfamily
MSTAEQSNPLRSEAEFAAAVEPHRGELRVHCYRMLGSLEDAEDLVQETFLRAWRARASFGADARFSTRAWLYRIATNACLDALRRRPRRVTLDEVAPAGDPSTPPAPPAELPWLQPFPDRLIAPAADEPGAVVVERETIELAFLAAIQHLPPMQRAVLILRDVVGTSASDTAATLETTVGSVNSALRRGRATLRQRLPERRADWTRAKSSDETERELLRRYVEAHEKADLDALAAVLREDVRLTMPPHPTWFDGREAILVAMQQGFDPTFGRLRAVVTGANLQPAAAHYLERPGGSGYEPLALDVLRIDDGLVTEISSFVSPELFETFGLPPALSPSDE